MAAKGKYGQIIGVDPGEPKSEEPKKGKYGRVLSEDGSYDINASNEPEVATDEGIGSIGRDIGDFVGGEKELVKAVVSGRFGDVPSALRTAGDAFFRAQSKAMYPFSPGSQRIHQGMVRGGTLKYFNPELGNSAEGSVGEVVGGTLPYIVAGGAYAPLQATKLAQAFPVASRIIGAGAPMATVGFARPADSLGDRFKQGAFEGGIGMAFQGLGEVAGPAKRGIKSAWGKYATNKMAKIDPDLADDAVKAAREGKVGRVLSSDKIAAKVDPIATKAAKAFDDVFEMRADTIEDAVIKGPVAGKNYAQTLQNGRIDADGLKREITKYVDDVVDKGFIDKTPKAIERLIKRIDDASVVSHNTYNGKWTNSIDFKTAHEIKKDLYQLNAKNYGKGNFDDYVSNAYKKAAKNINTQLRDISDKFTGEVAKNGKVVKGSGAYSKANDEVSALYDLLEEAGSKSPEHWSKLGGAKRVIALSKDPAGKRLLAKIDNILPQDSRVLASLGDIEKQQAINKLFASGSFPDLGIGGAAGAMMGSPFGPLGAGVGSMAGGAIGRAAGKAVGTPSGVGLVTRGLEYAPLGGRGIPPQAIPILSNALKKDSSVGGSR